MSRIAASISVPPIALALLAIASMQGGAAFAKSLFPEVGAGGVLFMRVGFAAILLFVLWRPKLTLQIRENFKLLCLFGIVMAVMSLSFYQALDRIPLGIASALEFTGPLGLAAFKSKRKLDLIWVILAAIGLLLLAPIGGFVLDIWGVMLALIAAFCLAAYIVLSARVGKVIPGVAGLAWAMAIGGLILMPIGILSAGSTLLQPRVLLLGLGVAILSSALPYSLEMVALRSLPLNVFGILKSLEPVAAALAGLLVLGEMLTLRATLAILLISLAAAGVSRFRDRTSA
ncbi:EamA family transporter [Spirulina sp. 06S082]|uniref:EamA family transporter n=1 Tax=Spirulina sp. 06S082 TaxID=3110248 RepID=UPI002B1EDF21|nr:EamA family transporter [Spirulina sp. 06S082]MEA5470300.1 EamA family transporter [Spirulina sp. 06S082]